MTWQQKSSFKRRVQNKEEIHPFKQEACNLVIATFRENRYYKYYAPLIKFLFFTECRPLEALALHWKLVGSFYIFSIAATTFLSCLISISESSMNNFGQNYW
jgi:hypothetical protein